MQYGEGFGELSSSRKFDLLQARVCIDNILGVVPLDSCEAWTSFTYNEMFGQAYPSDMYPNYVYMVFGVELEDVPENAEHRPGILAYTRIQPTVLDGTTGQWLPSPMYDPSKLGVLLSTNIRQTVARRTKNHPKHDEDELDIPIRIVTYRDKTRGLALDLKEIEARTVVYQDKLLRYAAPLVQHVLPFVSARN